MSQWTAEDIALLEKTVASSKNRQAAFAEVAKATNRKPGTVSQKFYQMERTKGNGAKATSRTVQAGGRSVKPAERRAAQLAGGTIPMGRASEIPTMDSVKSVLVKMSVDELVQLQAAIKSEVDQRRKDIAKLDKLFGGAPSK